MKEDSTGKVRLAKIVKEKIKDGSINTRGCNHFKKIKDVEPSSPQCEKCLELGDTWVHLRLCLTCGNVGCCDDSKNKHASQHFKETGHPVIVSYEPEEYWIWCYHHEVGVMTQR